MDVRQLVGVTDIARLSRVGRSTVTQWHSRAYRNGFPEPVHRLAMGPVWNVNVVLSWYANYVPDKGGRPGSTPSPAVISALTAPAGASVHTGP